VGSGGEGEDKEQKGWGAGAAAAAANTAALDLLGEGATDRVGHSSKETGSDLSPRAQLPPAGA